MIENKTSWGTKKLRVHVNRVVKQAPKFLGSLLVAGSGFVYMSYNDNVKKHPEKAINIQQLTQPYLLKATEFFYGVGTNTEKNIVEPVTHTTNDMMTNTAEIITPAIDHTRKLLAEILDIQPKERIFLDSPIPENKTIPSRKLETHRL